MAADRNKIARFFIRLFVNYFAVLQLFYADRYVSHHIHVTRMEAINMPFCVNRYMLVS